MEAPKYSLSANPSLTEAEVADMQHMEAECAACDAPCAPGMNGDDLADIETLSYPASFLSKIETTTPLFGTSKEHRWHVLLCTGVSGNRWPAHLDKDPDSYAAVATAELKTVLQSAEGTAQIHGITRKSEDGVDPEIECDIIIFPEAVVYKAVTRANIAGVFRYHMLGTLLPPGVPAPTPLPRGAAWVLICGHKLRDNRCWIAAQALSKQFHAESEARGIDEKVEVDLISHVGGHKYAGNVIVHRFLDADETEDGSSKGDDASKGSSKGQGKEGKGVLCPATAVEKPGPSGLPVRTNVVWYGRVRPEHVRAVVEKTVVAGEVLLPLLRGRTGQW